jgi:TetR/AcrR family transcriptional regulator, transcriptional repressor for nem operon
MGRPSDAKERLILAARDVIYAHSYEAATVDELCAATGVSKSSFYHFFSSKEDLLLTALESQWRRYKEKLLKPAFSNHLAPHEQLALFSRLVVEMQESQKETEGHMRGCPLGNLTLEMSTQNEVIRKRINHFFREWLSYLEKMLRRAKEQGLVPSSLDTSAAAEALLAYFEGVVLIAKGRNDPSLIKTMGPASLALIHYRVGRGNRA